MTNTHIVTLHGKPVTRINTESDGSAEAESIESWEDQRAALAEEIAQKERTAGRELPFWRKIAAE